jgi:HTH-type transcriptional regulator/antitoxin HigA
MEIKPIRTEADYEAALAEVEQLWGTEPGTPEGDRFEVLFTLVEAYEERHYPILPPDPVEAIKYYMDSRGLDRRDLEQYIGPSGRVSEVLSRKRPLTLAMIRKLNAGLGIPAEVLIQAPINRPYSADRDFHESKII